MTTDNADSAPLEPLPLPPGSMVPPGHPLGGHPAPYWAAPPLAPLPPRVWTALVVPVIAVVTGVVVSTIALLIPAAAELGVQGLADQERLMAWIKSYGASPGGFLVLLLPGQLVFLGAAVVAAWLSPVAWRARLGLTWPTMPWWALPLLLPATLFAGMCGDLLMRPFFDQRSEQLEMLDGLFRGPTGAFLALVTLLISVMPGFGEEMLFRGYTQRRLLQRWHPAAAVGVSSVLFACAHVDPAHVLGVLPIGVWLGVVAWLCGSIWPSILCHVANNAAAVLLTNAYPEAATEAPRFDASHLAWLAGTGVFMAASVWLMWRHRAPAPREMPATLMAAEALRTSRHPHDSGSDERDLRTAGAHVDTRDPSSQAPRDDT